MDFYVDDSSQWRIKSPVIASEARQSILYLHTGTTEKKNQ